MKKLLTAFILLIYLMEISLIISVAVEFKRNSGFPYLLIIPAIFGLIAFIIGCINVFRGLTQIFEPSPNVYRAVAVAKLSLIPFFITNFVICFILFAGLLNPFLFLSAFLIVPICIGITYGIMLVTSSYNLGFILYQMRTGEKNRRELIVHLIFQLIFILDVISSVLLFYKSRKIALTGHSLRHL